MGTFPAGSAGADARAWRLSMPRTTCDVIVEALLDWGVDTVFGLPGDGINGFMEALRKARERIRLVHTRHEEVAAMAASGYARFIGKLGVCFSTAVPGAVHLLNRLYDAKIDHAPVLAITGMTLDGDRRVLQRAGVDAEVLDLALASSPAALDGTLLFSPGGRRAAGALLR
jgi:glyoxylate carboligase